MRYYPSLLVRHTVANKSIVMQFISLAEPEDPEYRLMNRKNKSVVNSLIEY